MKLFLRQSDSFCMIALLLAISSLLQPSAAGRDFPVKIPAESKEFHEDIPLSPKAGVDCQARYGRIGELRLETNNFAVTTRTLANEMQLPFEGSFLKVVSMRKQELELDLVPLESIPAERRPLPGCHVLFEKSRCRIGQDEFAILKIETVKDEQRGVNELRCEIVRGGKILEQKFGVGNYLDLLTEHLQIKRILPAEKNFPAWIEVEHKNKMPEAKR